MHLICRRRAIAALGTATLVMCAFLALTGLKVAAVNEAVCQSALQMRSNPAVLAFKQCAVTSPIPPSCCFKMAPFVQYADCLQDARYRSMAESFLRPQVTLDRALKECLGG